MTNFIGPSAVHVPIPIYGEPVTDDDGHEYRPVTGYVPGYHVNIVRADLDAHDAALVSTEAEARQALEAFDALPDSAFVQPEETWDDEPWLTRAQRREPLQADLDAAVADLPNTLAQYEVTPGPNTPVNTWACDALVMIGGEIVDGEIVGGELRWLNTAFLEFADEAKARKALGGLLYPDDPE